MLQNDPNDPVFHELDVFFQALGLRLIDFGLRTARGSTSVNIVLFSPQGIGIDDLSQAHRLLIPQLEVLLKTEDLAVEVGSPGLDRNLKYKRELSWYVGKKLKLYLSGGVDWEEGVLVSYENEVVHFETKVGTTAIPVAQIQKAKLNDL